MEFELEKPRFPKLLRQYAVVAMGAIYVVAVVNAAIVLAVLVVMFIADNWRLTHPPPTAAQLQFLEPSMSYRAATAHRFRILVADEVADPEQRNTNLHEVSLLLNDPDRIAAIGSLGPGETDGYDADLRKIAHTLVPVAGWYTTHAGLRDAMLRRCRGRVYHNDECYAAYLGAVIAHRVPKGYVAKQVTVITRNPLRLFVNAVRSLPSDLGG